MACCQAPNRGRESVPAPTCPPENRGQPLGLPLLADAPNVDSHAAASAAIWSRDAATLGGRSLILLGIRLNI
jgi:hypothetical protein